ncbi:hypothetical protein D3C84_1060990 [compost metagenome]
MRRAFDLGQQHACDAGLLRAERQIRRMLRVIRRVDPHPDRGLRRVVQKVRQVLARLAFERLLHGVLEIDDHGIGASGQGLGKTLGSTSWHKQRGADDGSGHDGYFLVT